jgi:uncharacterized protein (DUF362 family)
MHDNAVSRRTFLSSAAVGAGGVLASGILPAFGEEYKSGWTDGKQINPAIDNLRVVCCIDPAMIKGDPRSWDVVSQNAPVVAEKVQANMDAMACSLAQKSAPHEAWGSIFMKPASKEWSDVKVAVKPNSFVQNNPRVAVINAVCKALISLGVQPSNIIIYDGGGDAKGKYGQYIGNGLPAGIIACKGNDAMGGTIAAPVPKPHKGKFKCSAALANGTIDILVNIAVNKGHSIGGITMTLKNHAGTFDPKPIHLGGGLDYILAFNKSEAVLGGAPVRQQLCVVDSIWAMTNGPFGAPNKRPCALAMGTFSPAVDYVVARRVREPMMGCTHPNTLNRVMSEFGYANFESLDFIKVEPAAL